jgi:hypothetical protein
MKLLEKFEAVGRQRRLADNTIDAYRGWIQQFLRFCATARASGKRDTYICFRKYICFRNPEDTLVVATVVNLLIHVRLFRPRRSWRSPFLGLQVSCINRWIAGCHRFTSLNDTTP